MSNVYIIQRSPGKNFDPAKEFGKLTIILDGTETPSAAYQKLLSTLKEFKQEDYLLLVGSPLNIAISAIVADSFNPAFELQFLVWDKEHYKYNCQKVTLS